MRVAVASDHAGFALKNSVRQWLAELGHEAQDLGPPDQKPVDYPDFASLVARAVGSGQADWGVLICGTGQGMAMTANKHTGVRAALCTNELMARMARRHNDANVLCLGGRILGEDLARAILDVFAGESFDGGRHARRLALVAELERDWRGGSNTETDR